MMEPKTLVVGSGRPHVFEPTIYRADQPWFVDRKAPLNRLRRGDRVRVSKSGAISVRSDAVRGDLDLEEREIVHKLLGYTWDRRYPMIAKRAGVVGGRAAVAGRRLPIWQIVGLERQGYAPPQLMSEFGLSTEQLDQALGYARRHREEIEQDILDQETASAGIRRVVMARRKGTGEQAVVRSAE